MSNNILYSKLPPQSIDIEKMVLGILMVDSGSVFIGMSKLFTEIFYLTQHQLIFKAIENLYDKNHRIDIMSVIEQLRKNNDLEDAGGAYEVTKLTNAVTSGVNLENFILLISELYLKRETINLSGNLINEAYKDSSDAFDIINSADNDLQKIQERIIGNQSQTIDSFGIKVIEQHSEVKQTGILGVSTGLKTLDAVICGLVSPDLLIIAARPGQGKTALALSITYRTSILSNIPCAWFSLEMDGVQLVRRLASIYTGIDHEKIRKGQTTQSEEQTLIEGIEKISTCKIFIDDKASMNVRHIRTRANLLKKRHGIKFIVIDYLQLMDGVDPKNKSRENIVSEISRSLKQLAKELQIPVIALSQLSREVEKRSDKMPQLSDLRESGGIEQDADEVVFLMRPEYYGMINQVEVGGKEYDVSGLTVCKIDKNRHGSTKNIALKFDGSLMKFSDYGTTNNFTPVNSFYETETTF